MPEWVLRGILRVETRSYYKDGTIVYVDKRRGTHGERGPFQCTYAAFRQVSKRGEQFWQIETDKVFAQEIATRYLQWLMLHYGKNDWYRVIGMYNAGPNRNSKEYVEKVKAAVN